MKLVRLLPAMLALLVGTAACQHDDTPPFRLPTVAEAEQVLASFVAATRTAKSADDYCAPVVVYLGSICDDAFAREGIAGMPTTPPRILSSDRIEGGYVRVLVVCGVDGKGNTYRSDFPVSYEIDQHRFNVEIPVFWNGTDFDGVNPSHPTIHARPTPKDMSCPG